jgi:UDP-galactopyranose mutase
MPTFCRPRFDLLIVGAGFSGLVFAERACNLCRAIRLPEQPQRLA